MFREFKVGELFETHTVSNKLTKASLSLDGTVPVYSSDTRNNGVLGYTEQEPTFIVDTARPTYVIFGDHTRTISIVHDSFCVMDNVKVLSPKFALSDEALLYIKTVWLKAIPVLGYARHWSVAKDVVRSLPVKPGTDEVNYTEDDIDWTFMESYIQELEESYIQELDAYLKETGLDDYTLTDDEREVLEREPVFKEFEVGELFDKLNLKRIKPTFDKRSDLSKVQTEEFDLPLVNAKAGSNGIMYYGRSGDWESDAMTIDIVNDGAVSTGMVYAQPQETGTLYNAYQIKLKSDVLSDVTVEHLLFLATTIQKSIQLKFNYSNKAVWAKVQNETIQLPVKPGTDEVNYTEDDIDWDYMASYVRALEKQVIADVVDYKNEVIATTKKLVKKQETLE